MTKIIEPEKMSNEELGFEIGTLNTIIALVESERNALKIELDNVAAEIAALPEPTDDSNAEYEDLLSLHYELHNEFIFAGSRLRSYRSDRRWYRSIINSREQS